MPSVGLIEVQDAETGAVRLVDTSSAAFGRHFQEVNARRAAQLKGVFRSGPCRFHLDSDRPAVYQRPGRLFPYAAQEGLRRMQPGKRQHGRFVIALLACVLLIGCREKESAPDYAVQKEFTRDSLRVQIELSSGQILLSDLLPIRITVISPAGAEIQWPDFAETLRDFQVHDWDDLGRQLLSDGKVQSIRQYRLEPLKAGDLQIPPLAFQCTPGAEAAPSVLATEALPVTVTATLPEDLSQVSLADIEDVVEIKGHAFAVWMAAIAAVCIAAAAAVIFVRSRSKRALAAPKIYKPAHEIALAADSRSGRSEPGRAGTGQGILRAAEQLPASLYRKPVFAAGTRAYDRGVFGRIEKFLRPGPRS